MNIYTSLCVSDKPMPYVYMCVRKQTGRFYFGSRARSSLKYPSNVDLPRYKTSSKIVKPDFDSYEWVILAEFFDPRDAWDFEQQLIHEHWGHPQLINQACQWQTKHRFATIGVTYKHTEETKRKISASNKGKKLPPATEETRQKRSLAAKNRPPVSEETRKKLSDAKKGKKLTEDHKQRLKDGHTKRSPHTHETKLKMKLSQQQRRAQEITTSWGTN